MLRQWGIRNRLFQLACLGLAGCQFVAPGSKPAVKEGPVYAISSDSSAAFTPAELESLKAAHSCDPIRTDSDFLGGLIGPGDAIAECLIRGNSLDLSGKSNLFLRFDIGSLNYRASVYLVRKAGSQDVRVIKTPAELRAFAAPIESKAEALSFVLATLPDLEVLTRAVLPEATASPATPAQTGSSYGVSYISSSIEGTDVTESGGNFGVRHLLLGGYCKGGELSVTGYSVSYRVFRDGLIEEAESDSASRRLPLFQKGPCPQV